MDDMELITQHSKLVYIKLSLINDAYWEIDQVQGEMVNISLTIDAESDIRRVSTITMHIADPRELASNYFGRWMDQMVRISYGIYDSQKNEIRWWLLGSFLFSTSGYVFDSANRQMSLSLVDMMAAATQERGSQLGYDIEYPANSSIANALKATVARFSRYSKTDICEFEDVIPYDISGSLGSYPISLLKSLIELFPWYEHFYSKDGVYTARRIPTAMNEEVVLNADEMDRVIISEHGDMSYSTIKNCIEIWGKEIDANYTATSCETVGNIYSLAVHSTFTTYESGALIAFTPDVASVTGQRLRVGELDPYDIVVQTGSGDIRLLGAGELVPDTLYVVKYTHERFVLQGEALIHVMCMEYQQQPTEATIEGLKAFHNCNNIRFVISPESAYACDEIGIVKRVLSEGDYSNIYTTELGHERAAYELWKATQAQDTLELETLFIPWLDVNQKVEYRSLATGEINQYLVRRIEVSPSSGTMKLRMSRFWPLYPWLGEESGQDIN